MLSTKDAAKIFSSKGINDVAHGDFDFVLKVANAFGDALGDVFSVEDVFQECYRRLKSSYKFEYYIKNIIAEKILLGRYSMNTATLLNEFRVGESKADSVILNGISTCYEIKSEYDSLNRLELQLSSYLKIFDKVNVVTTEAHLGKVEKIAPESVGILRLGKNDVLTPIRPALLSSEPMDVDILMASLRRNEYLSLVYELCGQIPVSTNTGIYDECRTLLRTVDSSKLRPAFCRIVKKSRKIDKGYVECLPKSLLVAGIEYRVPVANKAQLLQNLKIHFSKEALCTTPYSRRSVTN
ncbi:sce7726 family protein [Pseudomonas botevensis]|uniref:sce7726 family protein n=1 Tax=Pseudomonas botevensis TaxID=2842352 RepID=UPI001C3DF36E|nr:sce7726 family protein [Pseudomonas botevensis]MBV4475196.1 sce7726 family protein [Pseudomonas botevensis]